MRIKQNVQIIHTSKSMEWMGKHTIVQIRQNVQIIQGHIIRAPLYGGARLVTDKLWAKQNDRKNVQR